MIIKPFGSIFETWSAIAEDEIFRTFGFRVTALALALLVGLGLGEVSAFGNQGIQGFRSPLVEDRLGLGVGEVVLVDPGEPFLTLIIKWLSSSAVTLIHVSPSHSSAIEPVVGLRIARVSIPIRKTLMGAK